MEILNYLNNYSQKWDDKLNKLLDEGVVVGVEYHTLKLKLHTGYKGFLFFKVKIYDKYEVWLSNKDCAYGGLYSFNGNVIPSHLRFSPKQETLEKLFALETELRTPFINKAYE